MKFLGAFMALLALLGMLFFAVDAANHSAAEHERARAYAETQIIQAQSQARLTASTANAIMLTATLPWGILAILGLLGLALVALAFVVVTRRPMVAPPQIIERHIVYLPAPGQARRQVWQALSAGEGMLLELPTPAEKQMISSGDNPQREEAQ